MYLQDDFFFLFFKVIKSDKNSSKLIFHSHVEPHEAQK